MTGADQAIVSLYEDSGLTVEQIAEDQGYDMVSVKACLMQNSQFYREAVKVKEEAAGFSDQEERDFLQVITGIAMDTEVDPHTRLRAAIYGREDKRGRRDAVKKTSLSDIKKVNVTIIQFNQQLNRAQEARARALGNRSSSVAAIRDVVEIEHSEQLR